MDRRLLLPYTKNNGSGVFNCDLRAQLLIRLHQNKEQEHELSRSSTQLESGTDSAVSSLASCPQITLQSPTKYKHYKRDRLVSSHALHNIVKASIDNNMTTIDTQEATDISISTTSSFQRNNSERTVSVKQRRDGLSKEQAKKAQKDLKREAELLKNLSHDHIISVVGVSGDPSSLNFSLVLDSLKCSFSDMQRQWNVNDRKARSKYRCELLEHQFSERIAVAYDLASALRYLHSKGFLHRAIHPDSIGFDYKGNVQLASFGRCKKLQSKDQVGIDSYNATQFLNPCEYLAPEVIAGKPYGFTSDTYSFAILLWQIMSLQSPSHLAPQGLSTRSKLDIHKVKYARPCLDKKWDRRMQTLLRACWDHKASYRLTFPTICNKIDEYLQIKKHW